MTTKQEKGLLSYLAVRELESDLESVESEFVRFDDTGNIINDTVIVTVTDVVDPLLNNPANIPVHKAHSVPQY